MKSRLRSGALSCAVLSIVGLQACVQESLGAQREPIVEPTEAVSTPVAGDKRASAGRGCAAPVLFADDDLEKYIRELIAREIGMIAGEHLSEFTELFVDEGVTRLDGLGCFANLEELDLDDNSVTDLAPLAEMSSLVRLNLSRNFIYASHNRIRALSDMDALASLEKLVLGNNELVDLSGLIGLHSLRELELQDNRIRDLSGLNELGSLTVLRLGGNQLEELSPLTELRELIQLEIHDNPTIDCAAQSSVLTALEDTIVKANGGEFQHDCT